MKLIALTFLSLFLFLSCSKKEHDVSSNAAGEWVTDTLYQNDYFGFSFTPLEGWSVTKSKPKIDNEVHDSDLGNAYLEAFQKTYMPFIANSPDSSLGFNMVIENIAAMPISSAEQYMKEALKGLEVLKADIKILNRGKTETLMGTQWYTIEIQSTSASVPTYQKIYAKVKGKNAICLTTASQKQNDPELHKALESAIQFRE